MRLPQDRVPLRWLIGVSLAAGLCCLLLTIWLDLTRQREEARRAWRDGTTLATTLERQIGADLALFDLALREAVQASGGQIPGPQTHGPLKIPEHPLLARHVGFINVLNEAGDVVADSRAFPGPPRPMNFAGREYFQAHRHDPAGTVRIGHPFATGPGQNPLIAVSRRIDTPGGAFAGVVIAGVRLSWLRDLLPRDAGFSLTLSRADGTILARSPEDTEPAGQPAASAWGWRGGPRHDAAGEDPVSRRFDGLVLELTPRHIVSGLFSWPLVLTTLPVLAAVPLAFRARRLERHAAGLETAARHAHEERMRLLATMSHELRTPLTAIIGQADLLQEENGLTDAQAARLARLTEAGRLMRVIVNRVIDVARPGERAIMPVLMSCALDPLIDDCRGMMEESARAKGLRLTSHVAPTVPRHAMLDRGLVQQILLNLLHNAIKFTTRGTVELRLEGDATRLRFEVADTGPGIPPGKRRRLFRAYDRLDAEDARVEGSGLGLSITEGLVLRLGGRIGHRDNPGGGSVFWAELPLADSITAPLAGPLAADADAVKPEDGRAEGAAPASPPRCLNILLADDEAMTRAVTAGFLRAAGHTVTEVTDGEAAVRAAREGLFDVLLTDMRMPGQNGLETARRVRALCGQRGHVPIVLVTADLLAPHPGAAGAEDIDGCLMKPFTRFELLAAVVSATPRVFREEDGNAPVLDDAVLHQVRDSLGLDATEEHLRSAARRIEDLLTVLDTPGPESEATALEMAHDLTGLTGLLGLGALSDRLRCFEVGTDKAAGAAALRETAEASLRSLRRHRNPPMAA